MSEVARLYRYRSLLVNLRVVSAARMIQELEISPATFKRDLAKLRDQLHVPIVFDRELGGYLRRHAQGLGGAQVHQGARALGRARDLAPVAGEPDGG